MRRVYVGMPAIKNMMNIKMPQSTLIPAVLIYTLLAFGSATFGSTHIYLIEQYICRQYYTVDEPLNLGDGLIDESLCKIPEIQSQVARIYGVYHVVSFLPALILTGAWGKIARIFDKKMVLFLNGSSIVLRSCYFTIICYYHNRFNIRMIWLTPLFDILGGGQVILSSLIYSYIAESVDSKSLSGVLYNLTAVALVIAFLGLSTSSYLLRSHVWLLIFIGVSSYLLIVPTTLLFPRSLSSISHPPVRTATQDYESSASTETTSLLSPDPPPKSPLRTILHTLASNYRHNMELYTSILCSSPLSRFTIFAFFLVALTSNIRVIFTQWASVTYYWILADVHALSSFEMIVSGSMLLSLPYISRTYLLPRFNSSSNVDIFITKMALYFDFLGLALMSVAPNRVCFVGAITVYTLGTPLEDSLRSFSTGLIGDKGEVEKLYLGIGLVETLGGMIATAMWSGLFSNVVGREWLAERTPFWGVLGLMVALWFVLRRLEPFGLGTVKAVDSEVQSTEDVV